MAQESSKPLFSRTWWIVFCIAILAIVLVTIALVDSHDLPVTIIGAVLGVIMTIFASFILLKGQSEQQADLDEKQIKLQAELAEKQTKLQQDLQQQLVESQHAIERREHRESTIFIEKLSTYNNFLSALSDYVIENSEGNKKALIFHTMAIQMHAAPVVVQSFIDNVIEVIRSTTGNGDKAEISKLIEALNRIGSIFRNELYPASDTDGSSLNLDAFIEAITGSQVEPTEEQKEKDSEEEQKEDEEAVNNSKIQTWDSKIMELVSKGWILENGNDSFSLTSKESPVTISVYRKKGKYVVEASKGDDSEFSQMLKDNYGGSRRYGTWWRELPISNYGVKQDTLLAQLPINDRARASVLKWVDKLTEFTNH